MSALVSDDGPRVQGPCPPEKFGIPRFTWLRALLKAIFTHFTESLPNKSVLVNSQ